MVTIEEKLAYKKAKELTAQDARAFVKGIDDEILFDEVKRRYLILKGFVKKINVEEILLEE